MSQSGQDRVAAQVARLGADVLRRADEVADAMVERIQSAVPIYRTDVISTEELRRTCLANVEHILGPIGHVPATESAESRENGRRRAKAGVPLAAVMEEYRVAARYLWEQLAESAARAGAPADVTLLAASQMWLVQDTYTQEMAEGYREEMTAQTLSHEQERSALVQALLEGRVADTNLWEAADILRVPPKGPYVVIAAQVPDIGQHAVPRIECELKTIGIASAWCLQHDLEIGIACLSGGPSQLDRLATTIEDRCTGRVGISPCYNDLRDTPFSLRLARIALDSAFEGQKVTVFDRDPLAVTAAAAPKVMQRLAGTTLAALDGMPAAERAKLLETFGVWLDSGGSADAAAKRLFCHPNTVRHRLHRLEERTGRSLNDPRWIAELTLAFETDRRITTRDERS